MFDLNAKKSSSYTFDVEYSTNYDCDSSDCCDSICRCGTIESARVLDTIDAYFAAYGEYWKPKKDTVTIDDILALRFLRHKFKPEDIEVRVCGGYYGEEIDEVSYNDSFFWEAAKEFNSLSTKARLNKVLELEYGYVLPELKNHGTWVLKEVDPKLISKNETYKPNSEIIDQYKTIILNELYHKENSKNLKISSKNKEEDYNIKLCAPFAIKDGYGGYKLIDGYHRFAALTSPYKVEKYQDLNSYKKTKKRIYKDVYLDEIWIITSSHFIKESL